MVFAIKYVLPLLLFCCTGNEVWACAFVEEDDNSKSSASEGGSKSVSEIVTEPSTCRYKKTHITYYIVYRNSKVKPEYFRTAIATAFYEWQYYVPLTFAEVTKKRLNQKVNITFIWKALPVKKAIADTYFPRIAETVLDGMSLKIRFNTAKKFSFDPKNGSYNVDGHYDLYTTALHEIGHALGLEHTSDTNAIMFPKARPRLKNLSSTDILNIQKIYGKRKQTPRRNPNVRRKVMEKSPPRRRNGNAKRRNGKGPPGRKSGSNSNRPAKRTAAKNRQRRRQRKVAVKRKRNRRK